MVNSERGIFNWHCYHYLSMQMKNRHTISGAFAFKKAGMTVYSVGSVDDDPRLYFALSLFNQRFVMKKYILSSWALLLTAQLNAQLSIGNGVQLISNGPAVIVLQDISLINNGNIAAGGGAVKLTGSVPTHISAVPGTAFHELIMAKTGNTPVSLHSGIQVNNRVLFQSGLLELNQQELALAPAAFLDNESGQSRITGMNGGVVTITVPMNAPVSVNPGNLGAMISSPSNLGNVLIRRGHQVQSGTGLSGTVHRYYDIIPGNNVNLNAVLRLHYFDPELNAQAENALTLYKSADAGQTWTNQGFLLRNTGDNYVEQGPISSFSRWTLSSFATTLPVTGMEFSAQRKGEKLVQLQWKTSQEFNNKGFYVQRRKADETDFSNIRFVPTTAPGGNSYLPLMYSVNDTNTYKGITYYRIQQEDIDGKLALSPVRFVTGSDDQTVKMKVWPVPSRGDINILVTGVEKETLRVFDMKGRLLQQAVITSSGPLQLQIRQPGTYVIRLGENREHTQRIVVQ